MNLRSLLVLLLLAGGLLAWSSSFQVAENEYAIVARFGDPQRTVSEAGLHFKWPAPVDTVYRIDGRMHVLDPEPEERLTSDKKNLIVDAFLVWSVADPETFWVSLGNRTGAEGRLIHVIRSVTDDVISRHPFAALVSIEEQDFGHEELMAELTRQASERTRAEFGVEVHALRVKRLAFPSQNKQAVFDRMEAEREAFAATYRAEGVEQYDTIKSETELTRTKLLAEAGRQAESLRGEARAEAIRIYAEAIAEDPELYDFLRSLEVLEEGLSDGSTIVLPADHPLLQVFTDPTGGPPPGEGE